MIVEGLHVLVYVKFHLTSLDLDGQFSRPYRIFRLKIAAPVPRARRQGKQKQRFLPLRIPVP